MGQQVSFPCTIEGFFGSPVSGIPPSGGAFGGQAWKRF